MQPIVQNASWVMTSTTRAARERDQQEVRGYYAALDEVERLAESKAVLTEKSVQSLHALVMGGGKARAKPTPYRDEQNVIRDSRTRSIVYMPPEAKFVPELMAQMVAWINAKDELPVPPDSGPTLQAAPPLA
jgi:Fic family protein